MTEKNDYHVGERASEMPQPTQYEPSPFKKGRPPEPLQFEVNLTAQAHDRQKKSGMVQVNIPGFSPLKLYCDEQTPVGDDTAPPPLAYFWPYHTVPLHAQFASSCCAHTVGSAVTAASAQRRRVRARYCWTGQQY